MEPILKNNKLNYEYELNENGEEIAKFSRTHTKVIRWCTDWQSTRGGKIVGIKFESENQEAFYPKNKMNISLLKYFVERT